MISPIHLGNYVWKKEYDPQFNPESVRISKGLKEEYAKVAKKRGVHFFSAADYVLPSQADQEHLSENGHKKLAEVIYEEIRRMDIRCA